MLSSMANQTLKFILLSKQLTNNRGHFDSRILTSPVRWLKKSSYKSPENKSSDIGGAKSDNDQLNDIIKNRLSTETLKGNDLNNYNGFKLFNIEQNFIIDATKLQREMRKLQNILHPDRFVSQGVDIETIANDLSALVNDFYHVLGHPYERGKYLLSIISNKSREEIEESLDKLQMDADFLAKMMEIRETIDGAGNDTETMRRLHSDLEAELNEITANLDDDFKAKNIDSILRRLGKLKFVANCHRSVSNRLGTFSNF